MIPSLKPTVEKTETWTLQSSLPKGWISGAIGVLKLPMRGLKCPPVCVTVNHRDISKFIAIRQPSRNMKIDPLTEEEQALAVGEAQKILRVGKKWNQCTSPYPELQDCFIQWVDRELQDTKWNGKQLVSTLTNPQKISTLKLQAWKKFQNTEILQMICDYLSISLTETSTEKYMKPYWKLSWTSSVPSTDCKKRDAKKSVVIEKHSQSWECAKLKTYTFSISENPSIPHRMVPRAWEQFQEHMSKMPLPALQRFISMMGSCPQFISLPTLSRGGAATKTPISIWDVHCSFLFQTLVRLYPAALQPKADSTMEKTMVSMNLPNEYISPHPPLLWDLVRKIKDFISKVRLQQSNESSISKPSTCKETKNKPSQTGWRPMVDTSKKRNWKHQTDTLNDLFQRFQVPVQMSDENVVTRVRETDRQESVHDNWKHVREPSEHGAIVWLPPGAGKTRIVLQYLQILQKFQPERFPKYLLYFLPHSSMKSILDEFQEFGLPLCVLNMNKTQTKKTAWNSKEIPTVQQPKPFTVTFIEHDQARKAGDFLLSIAHESFIVADEFHKAQNNTQRSSILLQMTQLSFQFIAMTGTPIIDTHTWKLLPWLAMILDYEVNLKNFWSAATGMIAQRFETGVCVETLFEEAPWISKEDQQQYQSLLPPNLGGSNPRCTLKEIAQARAIAFTSCTQYWIEQLYQRLTISSFQPGQHGIFAIAENIKHQTEIRDRLIELGCSPNWIVCISSTVSVNLTPTNVKTVYPEVRLAITTLNHNLGYNMTRFSQLWSMVYPANGAIWEQLWKRIDRLGQPSKVVQYHFVVESGGLMRSIYKRQHHVRTLNTVLKHAIAGVIDPLIEN